MSPVRAILLHSPGRKPWVRHWHTFFEPRRGGTFPTNAKPQTKRSLWVPLLRSSIRFCLCIPRVSYRALPSFHPGLWKSIALKGSYMFGWQRVSVLVVVSAFIESRKRGCAKNHFGTAPWVFVYSSLVAIRAYYLKAITRSFGDSLVILLAIAGEARSFT